MPLDDSLDPLRDYVVYNRSEGFKHHSISTISMINPYGKCFM